ncbi:MAG: undecaprenyl-phosphate glucose phosphotransferase [Myxococcota bacterium]|nr:undecaprenyl-phosphate glucose phosphotransferase [Myxococcota bacterium]
MFGRFQRFYESLKVTADLAVLMLAFAFAYLTRFHGPLQADYVPPVEDSVKILLLSLVVFPFSFHQARLYATNRSRTHIAEVFEIFKAMVTGSLILVAVAYFLWERYSRLTLGIYLGYSFLGLTFVRLMFRQTLNEIRRRGHNLKSILVVGAGELGERVIDTIENHRELGFRVVGVLTRKPEKVGTRLAGVPIVGLIQEVEAILDRTTVDHVIVALPHEEHAHLKSLMEVLALRTVDVKIVPDLFQYVTLYGGLEEFGGLPIISLQGGPLYGWNLITKRLFDVLFAAVALVLVSPIMLLTAVAVKVTSRGPLFYAQERMGMDGAVFPILKFRTMKVNSESLGAQMASKGDPRRTVVGTFLRVTSIDELPQLVNVLVGHMSLVGPRPERPVFIEEFKKQIPKYHLRHKVKAGITGWAQINGLRGQTSIEKRIEYDLYYIENWSLLLDLKILVRTALGGFLSKNAY